MFSLCHFDECCFWKNTWTNDFYAQTQIYAIPVKDFLQLNVIHLKTTIIFSTLGFVHNLSGYLCFLVVVWENLSLLSNITVSAMQHFIADNNDFQSIAGISNDGFGWLNLRHRQCML